MAVKTRYGVIWYLNIILCVFHFSENDWQTTDFDITPKIHQNVFEFGQSSSLKLNNIHEDPWG